MVKRKRYLSFLDKLGIETRVRDLQEFYGGQKKADWDVGIVIDAIRTASSGIDVIILASGDGDFVPLVEFLKNKGLKFDHIEYPDHYSFRINDIEELAKKELIITTEKDFVRLTDNESLESKLFYLPIEITIDRKDVFDDAVKSFVD